MRGHHDLIDHPPMLRLTEQVRGARHRELVRDRVHLSSPVMGWEILEPLTRSL
jgi:hypothetical protein